MKKNENEVRSKMIVVRVNDLEYEELQKLHKKSIERQLSNYLRKVILQKPVVIKYRNSSADDFLKSMAGVVKELNRIGNNYNQAVKKLHILEKIPEFRTWIMIHDKERIAFLSQVKKIEERVQQLYEQWLQE